MAKATIDPQKAYAHLKNRVNWAICDKCGWHWPENKLNFRDGILVCPNHTDYKESTNQRTVRGEKEAARLAKQKEPIPKYPHAPEMRNVVGVEKLNPSSLNLLRGGANGAIVITGRNLSVADTITLPSSVSLVSYVPGVIDPDTRGNTATLTVNAPALATSGDYDLSYNGDVFKAVFQVRG